MWKENPMKKCFEDIVLEISVISERDVITDSWGGQGGDNPGGETTPTPGTGNP